MMTRFKVKKEFLELHLPDMHLRRQHLTDEEVARLKQFHPGTFHNYFEEIGATGLPEAQDKEPVKSKSKK